MNNLKFRAWDKLQEEMWHVRSINFDTDIVWLVESEDEPDQAFMVKNTDVIVEQFTGLYDKNGVEIYDGDVLFYSAFATHTNDRIVKFHDGAWVVEMVRSGQCGLLNGSGAEEYEVIGNIHEVNHE